MTKRIVDRLSEVDESKIRSALNLICGALMAYDTSRGANPYDAGLDVERVFVAADLLGQRRSVEITPFVAAWHPAVEQLDPMNYSAISTSDGRVFQDLTRRMIEELVTLTATSTTRVRYLVPLVASGALDQGITIATLNYDLSIEQAAAVARVPVYTGIESWVAERRWHWPAQGVRLLKLHGSVDWAWDRPSADGELRMIRATMSPTEVRLGRSRDPALLFGHGGKLRAEGPFLSLLAQFEAQLAATDRVVIIGYSFRDDHINELLRVWISDDHRRHVVVVDPSFPSDTDLVEDDWPPNPFPYDMYWALASPEREGNPPSRMTVIRHRASKAIRDLWAARASVDAGT